jgi:hypothetical protein
LPGNFDFPKLQQQKVEEAPMELISAIYLSGSSFFANRASQNRKKEAKL